MPAEALDMALDDLVQGGKSGRGKGKGTKGSGKSGSSWGKGASRKGKGKRTSYDKEDNEDKENAPKKVSNESKMDMSLEDVIDKDKGKGKGKRGKDSERKGKGRGAGKGKRDWGDDSYGYKGGRGYDNGYEQGKGSKGWSKGKRSFDDSEAAAREWGQHDDRVDDDDDRGKGRGRRPEGGRDAGGPRAWSDNDRNDRTAWQRIEQAPERATRRTMGRDREVGRSSKVAESRSAPQKRRAVEEPEGGRATKSVKVTNIPRDVNVQDIRDAFEAETGKITRCRLDRGTAWIAFATSGAARKAIDTFDRGELNGQHIGVVLDH